MKIQDIHSIYFLGIGGIGMSALARYFNARGIRVSGYDKTPTLLTSELERDGIHITFEDSINTLMKDADLVVYTPAIPKNHLQFNYYKDNGFVLKKRAEVLGLIANELFNISIAGSHGKTSTSSLVAHLLHTGNKDVSAFLGGICLNFGSNYIDGNTYAVAEADEFDRSFLQLTPNIALVTSVDTDHLDIYGNFEAIQDSFKAFLSQVREGSKIILHQNVDQKIVPENHKVLTYSYQDTQSDYFAQNIQVIDGATHFELNTPHGIIKNLILNYGGKHNAENAIGASAIALSVGVSEEDLRKGLATFLGVRRRFQTAFKSDKYVLIDDYAHHPREIDAVIQTVRDLYPNKKLTVIFQPHLFSRTKDLAIEFGQSLSAADQVYLLPIYPARELPMEGVTSDLILDAISHNNKKIIDKSSILKSLQENAENEIIMTVGAGDIDTMTSIIANWLKSIS
jgi:UDP-N-acetylmuramate--alanine ligase